jgi:hypothetical protein
MWHLILRRYSGEPFFGSWNFAFRIERYAGIPHDQGKVVKKVLGTVVGVDLRKIFSSRKGSSINDITQFLIIFDTTYPIVTPFTTKALVLLSQNP